MKLKVTLSLTLSVSGTIDVPENTKITNNVMPTKLANQVKFYKEDILWPKLQEKLKKAEVKSSVTLMR